MMKTPKDLAVLDTFAAAALGPLLAADLDAAAAGLEPVGPGEVTSSAYVVAALMLAARERTHAHVTQERAA